MSFRPTFPTIRRQNFQASSFLLVQSPTISNPSRCYRVQVKSYLALYFCHILMFISLNSEIYQVTGPVERFAGQIASQGFVVGTPLIASRDRVLDSVIIKPVRPPIMNLSDRSHSSTTMKVTDNARSDAAHFWFIVLSRHQKRKWLQGAFYHIVFNRIWLRALILSRLKSS